MEQAQAAIDTTPKTDRSTPKMANDRQENGNEDEQPGFNSGDTSPSPKNPQSPSTKIPQRKTSAGDSMSTKSMSTWGGSSFVGERMRYPESCGTSSDSLDASMQSLDIGDLMKDDGEDSYNVLPMFPSSLPNMGQDTISYSDLHRSTRSLVDSSSRYSQSSSLYPQLTPDIPTQVSVDGFECDSRGTPRSCPSSLSSSSDFTKHQRPAYHRSQSDQSFIVSPPASLRKIKSPGAASSPRIGRSRSDKQDLQRLARHTSMMSPPPPPRFTGGRPRPTRLKEVAARCCQSVSSSSMSNLSSSHHHSLSNIHTSPVQTTLHSSLSSLSSRQETKQVQGLRFKDPYGRQGKYSGDYNRMAAMPHGKGRLDFYEKGRPIGYYDGSWVYGEWSGYGLLINEHLSQDGSVKLDRYEGEFLDNAKHGKGTMKYRDGRTFQGTLLMDKIVQGTMIYQDGAIYEGRFREGKRHGRGIYQFADGSFYEGQFQDDTISGHGHLTWPDGGSYEGEWVKGQPDGFGREYHADGRLRYEGLWCKGQSKDH